MSNETKKIVVIGDGTCGKTCLLMVYVENKFPEEYVPTVFDSSIKEVVVDGTPTTVLLMDTSGQEDYERLRLLQYIDTNVFIICFAVNNRTSFDNVKLRWIKEIKRLNVPVVLVATKLDIRTGFDTQNMVSTSEGENLAKKIKACSFIECSAKDGHGVDEVFETAVRAALKPKTQRSSCIVL